MYNRLLEETARRAIEYLDGLDGRRVSPAPEAVQALARLDEPLPRHSTPAENVLALLDEIGSPATVAMAGPRYFGFVIGGSLPATVAANWLAAAWDQNAVFFNTSPTAATLETVALRWLVDLFHLPSECAGAFVTGATMANLTALAAARYQVLTQANWDVEGNGLFGAPPITVIVGAEVHASVIKALGLLGLGRNRIVRIPVDSQGRMRPEAMPSIDGPTIVCAQAGNVNTGSFDPFVETCQRAHAGGAWVHVDGAFGLWAAAVPSLAHLTAGLANADSWAMDAHKWLNVPYDSGLAFVRHAESLRAAMAISAAYLPAPSTSRSPSDWTPELSRRARGVEIWAALRSLGMDGLVDLIERTCRHARRFAEGLGAAGYHILNDVALNQVLVSFGDTESTNRVIAEVQNEGTCWAGGTVWQGQTAMRISVSSWATTDADVEHSLAAMLRVAANVRR